MDQVMMQAFNGESAVRARAIERLSAHFEGQRLTAGALFWNGKEGSVAASLIDSNDPADWESQLGLAAWIAYALDAVIAAPIKEGAVAYAVRLLNAVPVGADTRRMGSQVIDTTLGSLPEITNVALAAARDEVRALHQRALRGDEVAPAEWRAARRKALAATDDVANEQEKALGSVIEAAAWDPASSPTAVSDMLRMMPRYTIARTDEILGWTQADHEAVKTKLDEVWNTHLKPNPKDTRTVFDIVAEIDPATDAKIREYNASRNRLAAKSVSEAGDRLLEAMGAAA